MTELEKELLSALKSLFRLHREATGDLPYRTHSLDYYDRTERKVKKAIAKAEGK